MGYEHEQKYIERVNEVLNRTNQNYCICCGEQAPEGMQVCPKCRKENETGKE